MALDQAVPPPVSGRIGWLASYPKSGNTWLRLLLAHYRDEDFRGINAMSDSIASARFWFDEPVGIEASLLDPDLVERLRPATFRQIARETTEPLYVKIHDAWQRTSDGTAMFPADVTLGCVYIVRNPLDIVASFAAHLGTTREKAAENLCNPEYRLAAGDLGGLQIPQRMGTWSDHVRSWVDRSGLPVHVVRYEDMHADTAAAFRGVLEHLGIPVEEIRLARAVATCRFDNLQQAEAREGFRERPPTSKAFFRQGAVGRWTDELPASVIDRVRTVNGETMARFGYLEGAP